jgi:gas vesicle protein
MGETSDDIRAEIEETRARMGDTVEAIGYKADVKSRMKESVAEKKDSLLGTIGHGKDSVVGKADSLVSRVGGIVPDGQQVQSGAAKAGISKENPLGLAVVGAAVGFVVGTLVPKTRVEDEKLGELSDQVVDKAKQTGQEALEHGKQVAQETAQSAQETFKESAQQHGQEVKETAQENAQQAAPSSA